jgi:hypothetical protein
MSPAPDPFGPGYRDFLAARTRFLEARGAEAEIRRLERAWTASEHRTTRAREHDPTRARHHLAVPGADARRRARGAMPRGA